MSAIFAGMKLSEFESKSGYEKTRGQMAFSSVLTLIADLDRAGGGTVLVDQRPIIQLQQKLHASP